jgi:hypothetical protein
MPALRKVTMKDACNTCGSAHTRPDRVLLGRQFYRCEACGVSGEDGRPPGGLSMVAALLRILDPLSEKVPSTYFVRVHIKLKLRFVELFGEGST